jgi:hypothetical protein
MTLLRFIGEFILQVFITAIVVYFLFTWWHALPAYESGKIVDPVSLANTFMVFVTFIVVVATVAISIGAVFYAKQYSQAKERILSENLDEVIKALIQKQDIRDDFIGKMLNSSSIKNGINEHLESLNSNVVEQVNTMDKKIDEMPTNLLVMIKEQIFEYEKRVSVESESLELEDTEVQEQFSQLDRERES